MTEDSDGCTVYTVCTLYTVCKHYTYIVFWGVLKLMILSKKTMYGILHDYTVHSDFTEQG